MTDARTTQVAVEQWGDGSPSARVTQVAIEQWATVASGPSRAVLTQVGLEQWANATVTSVWLTQIGLEQWAGVTPPPVFVCGLAQRWDVGQWDQATWDGQIGICGPGTSTGQFTVNPQTVTFVFGHILTAQTGSIVVNGTATGLLSGRSLPCETGSIVVSGVDATFTRGYYLDCTAPMQIKVNPIGAQVTLTLFQQPGFMEFGTPTMVPMRW